MSYFDKKILELTVWPTVVKGQSVSDTLADVEFSTLNQQ